MTGVNDGAVAMVPAGPPGLLAKLVAAVRPEFRAEVFQVDPADPVFGGPPCRVGECDRAARLNGLCTGHCQRWYGQGRPIWTRSRRDRSDHARRHPVHVVRGRRLRIWTPQRRIVHAAPPARGTTADDSDLALWLDAARHRSSSASLHPRVAFGPAPCGASPAHRCACHTGPGGETRGAPTLTSSSTPATTTRRPASTSTWLRSNLICGWRCSTRCSSATMRAKQGCSQHCSSA